VKRLTGSLHDTQMFLHSNIPLEREIRRSGLIVHIHNQIEELRLFYDFRLATDGREVPEGGEVESMQKPSWGK
jgi:hypothetical protein